jgi:hypothetical protein
MKNKAKERVKCRAMTCNGVMVMWGSGLHVIWCKQTRREPHDIVVGKQTEPKLAKQEQ